MRRVARLGVIAFREKGKDLASYPGEPRLIFGYFAHFLHTQQGMCSNLPSITSTGPFVVILKERFSLLSIFPQMAQRFSPRLQSVSGK
jgi:hypothetical protein